MNKLEKFTYWECKLCEYSWSGRCDLDEMRNHLDIDHNFPGAWSLSDEDIQDIIHRRMIKVTQKREKDNARTTA